VNAYSGQVPDTEPAGQWLKQAACLGRYDEMHPDNSEAGIANAKRICEPCPVRDACLADALRTGDNHWGIRGGLKPEERRKLAKEDSLRPPRLRARPETLADAFRQRTTRTVDGHLTWNGDVHIKFEGERYTAFQAAFIVGHGREPEGPVRRTCAAECFRSDHLTDAVIRGAGAAARKGKPKVTA
jgi:hypothetical protein